jgi:hypothetical protein
VKKIAQISATILPLLLFSCMKQETTKRQAIGGSTANLDVKWSAASLGGSGINLVLGDSIVNDQFVGADNDADGHNPVDQMLKAWNASNGSLTFFQVPATQVANREYANIKQYENDGEQGIYKSPNWFTDVDSRALAVTQYRGIRRNIGTSSEYVELTHADIILNYRDYNFTTDANSGAAYDFHTVIVHELGHFIGLGHTSSGADSVMSSTLSIFDSDRSPSALDQQNLATNYGTAALTAGASRVIASAISSGPVEKVLPPSAIEDSEGVHGLIELRVDGSCHHYENGELIESH